MTHILGLLLCALLLGWSVRVLAAQVVDCHHRGLARVHRGTSWTPKTSARPSVGKLAVERDNVA